MSKKALRLLVVALLVAALIPAAGLVAGAQTSGISYNCGGVAAGANAIYPGGMPAATSVGFAPLGAYTAAATNLILPQHSNGGIDGKGRTVLDASAFGFYVNVWVDAAWTAGSNVTLTNNATPAAGVAGDTFCGAVGDDLVKAGAGNDVVNGHSGNDKLYGQGGNDILHGRGGDDKLNGGADSDMLIGGAGNDVLLGRDGGDFLNGGPGNDVLKGHSDNDVLLGGGAHRLDGGPFAADGRIAIGVALTPAGDPDMYADGDDVLDGGGNDDVLIGGSGADILKGGSGDDVLVGEYDDPVGATGRTAAFFGLGGPFAAAWPGAAPYGFPAVTIFTAVHTGDDLTSAGAFVGLDFTVDGVADYFGANDDIRCGAALANADGDTVDAGGGSADQSSNDCENSNAEIQLA